MSTNKFLQVGKQLMPYLKNISRTYTSQSASSSAKSFQSKTFLKITAVPMLLGSSYLKFDKVLSENEDYQQMKKCDSVDGKDRRRKCSKCKQDCNKENICLRCNKYQSDKNTNSDSDSDFEIVDSPDPYECGKKLIIFDREGLEMLIKEIQENKNADCQKNTNSDSDSDFEIVDLPIQKKQRLSSSGNPSITITISDGSVKYDCKK